MPLWKEVWLHPPGVWSEVYLRVTMICATCHLTACCCTHHLCEVKGLMIMCSCYPLVTPSMPSPHLSDVHQSLFLQCLQSFLFKSHTCWHCMLSYAFPLVFYPTQQYYTYDTYPGLHIPCVIYFWISSYLSALRWVTWIINLIYLQGLISPYAHSSFFCPVFPVASSPCIYRWHIHALIVGFSGFHYGVYFFVFIVVDHVSTTLWP